MQTCVLNRSTLLTGAAEKAMRPVEGSMLFHEPTGLACALGQYLLRVGIPSAHLAGKHIVDEHWILPDTAEWVQEETGLVDDILDTNDSRTLHQIRREAKLKKLFAEQDVNVTFTGRYADATLTAKRYVRSLPR